MKPISLAAMGLAALLAAAPAVTALGQANTTAAQPTAPAAAVTDPQQFADMAASSNMFEIQSSELALEMSQNEEVRAFAEQMIADHTLAGEDMMEAAELDGITPPSEMNEQHQSQYDALASADEAAFDQGYIEAQVMAHEEAVGLFEGFSTEGEESAMRDFAVQTLPTLQMHLEHVREMSGGM